MSYLRLEPCPICGSAAHIGRETHYANLRSIHVVCEQAHWWGYRMVRGGTNALHGAEERLAREWNERARRLNDRHQA